MINPLRRVTLTGIEPPKNIARPVVGASVDHAVLLALMPERIDDRRVLDLAAHYLGRTVDDNCLSQR
jgi:hypothetical protein